VQIQGMMVVSGSGDGTAKLWDLSVLEDLCDDDENDNFDDNNDNNDNNDNTKIITKHTTDTTKQDTTNESYKDPLVTTFYGHSGGISCLQFDQTKLLTGSIDKTIKSWDIHTGSLISTLTDFDIDNFDNLESTRTLNQGYNIESTHTLNDSSSFVSSLHFYQHALAAGFGDGSIRLIDLRTLKCHRTLVGHSGSVTTTLFDDYEVVSGSVDKTVRVM
jgi:mitochondrial division protein 1